MPAVVVIGGGAAGIAAARMLWVAGVDVLLVEASSRLGGRALSLTLELPEVVTSPPIVASASVGDTVRGVIVDAGCGWLHSAERNPWTSLAEHYGFTVDRAPANWTSQWRDLGFPPAEQAAFHASWEQWEAAAHAALDGPDRPLSDFIAANDRWCPLIDAISGYANGAPLAAVSLHDWAAYEDAATEDNWTIEQGYGTVVCHHASNVPFSLTTIVSRINHRGTTIRIETDRGTIEADHVIVCVPTTTLAREAITFDPPLPAKHEAAAALPLGLADKVFLHVRGADLPANGHLIGNPHSSHTASHRLSPFGWPLIESFFGGDCAEALANAGDGAAADFAINELVALLGSNWRVWLTPLAATRWRAHPHIHGSYSHARVGAAGQRAKLAEPVDARLFFAGEACSAHDFSTAHGAYETGIAAARAVLDQRAG